MVGGENERVVSSPSVSSPLSAGKYLHRLFALCCRRNGIALESLFAADLRRPATALCLSARRELRLPSVNMSARIFRAARRPATFIEAVAQTLICRLLFATRPPLPRAIPHASSIHARSSLGQTPTDLLPLPTCTFFLSFFSRPNLRICPELFPLEFLFSFLFLRLNFLFLLPFHRIKTTFRGSGGAIRKRRDESFYI